MFARHEVVVDDNDRQADGLGFVQGERRSGAAIHGDDEVGPGVFKVAEGGGRRAVALFQPVRHVEADILTPAAEIAGKNG